MARDTGVFHPTSALYRGRWPLADSITETPIDQTASKPNLNATPRPFNWRSWIEEGSNFGRGCVRKSDGVEADVEVAGSAKILQLLKNEVRVGGFRLQVARCLLAPIPPYVGSRTRVRILRTLGFSGIHPTTVLGGLPTFTGRGRRETRLLVGPRCHFNVGAFFDLTNTVTIGRNVSIGQQVMFLTETHESGGPGYRAGRRMSEPIFVGDGCWIGARATILPGVVIGKGAIVAAGSVVNKHVRSNTIVGGVPAKELRRLESC